MRSGKIRLVVLSCLLGALTAGGSDLWNPEEDAILVQFILDNMKDPYLTPLDCVDRINAWRRENGWVRKRTEVGVYKCWRRWRQHLQAKYPELIFQRTARSTRKVWSYAEKGDLRTLVKQNTDEEGKIKWDAVCEGMCQKKWRRSSAACREKWRKCEINMPQAKFALTLSLQELCPSPVREEGGIPDVVLESTPELQKFLAEEDRLFGLGGDKSGLDFNPEGF